MLDRTRQNGYGVDWRRWPEGIAPGDFVEAPAEAPAAAVPEVWGYLAVGGWVRLPDPIPWPEGDGVVSGAEVDALRQQAGFGPGVEINEDGALSLVIHEDTRNERFLVEVVLLSDSVYTVLAPDLPSFLALLGQLLTLARQAAELERLEQEFREKAARQKRK
jgi:hypothetical protein